MSDLHVKPFVTDYSDSQSILNALPGSLSNDFFANTWTFEININQKLVFDFTVFAQFQERYAVDPEWKYQDFLAIVKRAWLDLASDCSVLIWAKKFKGLALFFSALSSLDISRLTKDNLPEVLSFLLTHTWVKNRPERLNTLVSYVSFNGSTNLETMRQTFHSLNIDLISPNVTSHRVFDSCSALIPRLTDENLTASDWRTGNGLDRLTLDYGQYYVEYCMDFFKEHFATSVAVYSVMNNVKRFARRVGWNQVTTHRYVMLFLDGATTMEACYEMSNGKNINSFMKIETVRFYVREHFEEMYHRAHFMSHLLEDSTIELVLNKLQIEVNQTQIDRFRAIIWSWHNKEDIDETCQLLKSCVPPVKFYEFDSVLREIKMQQDSVECELPTKKFYNHFGLTKDRQVLDSSDRPCRNLVRLTELCGLTAIQALTGWRSSEFGFPISSLKKLVNDDVLDQYAFPFRYQIEWYVFKTHGRVSERREITFNIAVLINLMNVLIGNESDEPCLYRFLKSRIDKFDSSHTVSNAVQFPWLYYVANYPGFKTLDDLKIWNALKLAKDEISEGDETLQAERSRLLALRSAEEWERLEVNPAMRAAWIRSRNDLPILKFYFSDSLTTEKINWLQRYKNRTLNSEWLNLLDERLSEITREWINSLSTDREPTAAVTRRITVELLKDCLYPTPHAFRHMWAEAVYRRFDGDAGWMIRSQFKHISKKMWLAYIRDKDNRNEHQMVKARVISSIVSNYLINKGKEYAGQMHIFFRRLMKHTNVMSVSEQAEFVDRIATTEIIDIKANPWGYCLLKQRTRKKARCAEMGEPQRHNASPSLCMGCPHNLVQSSNIDWILLHLYTHISALQNPLVPSIFKDSSYKLVKDVTRHVAILNPNHESLIELRNTLKLHELGDNQ